MKEQHKQIIKKYIKGNKKYFNQIINLFDLYPCDPEDVFEEYLKLINSNDMDIKRYVEVKKIINNYE